MKTILIIFILLNSGLAFTQKSNVSSMVYTYEQSIIEYLKSDSNQTLFFDTELISSKLSSKISTLEINYLDKKNCEQVSKSINSGDLIYTMFHDDSRIDTILIYIFSETYTGNNVIENNDSIPELIDPTPSHRTHDGMHLIMPTYNWVFEKKESQWVLYRPFELFLKENE